jgi:YegS/Rv2252/BmrU family lipid kinase
MTTDIVFIVNPVSGNGRTGRNWGSYEPFFRRHLREEISVRRTERPWQAAELTKDALTNGASTIVSVGGDGTLNEVTNGFLDGTGHPWNGEARLAVLSLGTGSDFIKTLGGTRKPEDLVHRLQNNRVRLIDAGLCEYVEAGVPRSRHFINVAEVGSGGAVVNRVNRTTKILGGKTSFLIAILRTLPRYRNTAIAYAADGGPRKEIVMNDLVVANGRFFGGGLQPAPRADLGDGLFDIVIIGDIDFKTTRKNLSLLREGRHLELPYVTWFRAKELTTSTGEEMIDLDGECVGRHAQRFEILPKVLRLVG